MRKRRPRRRAAAHFPIPAQPADRPAGGQLGLALFERRNQRLYLTNDGRTFLAEARGLLKHAERLESLGKRLGRGEEGGLCIGYVNHAIHAGVLPGAVRAIRGERPNIHIALYNMPPSEQFEGLRQRSLDIALVCEPPPTHDPDLRAQPVLDDPMLLAIPAAHPLASKAELAPPTCTSRSGSSRVASPTR
jgi:DNA-binding transcriptional LysR family regulator